MNFYITNFYNIRHFKENVIPISTALSDPFYFHSKTEKWKKKDGFYVNDNNVLLGIREPALCPELDLAPEEICSKNCIKRGNPEGCAFLRAHEKAILKVDFTYIMSEFKRVAEDVRKVTGYKGEPDIVLLVYEAENNPCSERAGLKKLFESHGVELREWKQEIVELQIDDDELPF